MSDNIENNGTEKLDENETNEQKKPVEESADNSQQQKEVRKNRTVFREILDWIVSIGVALIAVMLINQFLFVQVMVDGHSMDPTLSDRDRLFTYRFMYEPKQQDIVVVQPFLETGTVKGKLMFGRTLYIKRVIAVGGQTVSLENGKVYVDGELLDEPYIPSNVGTYEGTLPLPVTVPEGCVFVMGDNREHSRDSRDITVGILREEQVVGKAVFRIFPFSSFGLIE